MSSDFRQKEGAWSRECELSHARAQKQRDNIPAKHYQPLNHVSISEKWTIVSELLTGSFRRFYGKK